MIKISAESPFAPLPDPLFPDRVRVIGLGQTGVMVCDQIVLHGPLSPDLVVIDTDQQTIEGSVVAERHLLGQTLTRGLGCSGDLDLAREIVALEELRIQSIARECDFLILILSLAGATAIAAAEHLLEIGKRTGARVIVLGVQPFAFEGLARRERAIHAIRDLRAGADAVLILSHDRLTEHPLALKNIRQGFHLMHCLLAQAAQSLSQIVTKRGLIQLSFSDLRSLFGRYLGAEVLENCWIAHTQADLRTSIEEIVDDLFSGPMLTDEGLWKHVDHALVTLSGTRHLGLADVQELLRAIKQRLPGEVTLATSANLEIETGEQFTVTLLLATTAPVSSEMPTPPKKPVKFSETRPLPGVCLPSQETGVKFSAQKRRAASETTRLPLHPPPPTALPDAVTPPAPSSAPTPPLHIVSGSTSAPLPQIPQAEAKKKLEGPVAPTAPRRTIAKQEEMQFEALLPGRFEKAYETIYQGENLDHPTYRRRGLKIRL